MAMSFVSDFDSRVSENLLACGVRLSSPCTLAAAVSGGADSVSLLTALSHILPPAFSLCAVTVNHNLRPEEETAGDAAFVQDYCASLGISCFRYDIPRGAILDEVRRYGESLEEAARDARYACFERCMAEHGIDFLCLAHNRNDQLETLLMRVLAGGGVESLSGIQMRRDRYLRPLLDVTRADIERYLAEQGIAFRTDCTNADNALLRNRVRNVLVPSLDMHFSGWSKALLSLSAKMRDDAAFFDGELEAARKRCRFALDGAGSGRVVLDCACFCREAKALRIRLLFAAAASLSRFDGGRAKGLAAGRIPYAFFSRIADLKLRNGWKESCSSLSLHVDEGLLIIERTLTEASERGFFLVVRGEGSCRIGSLDITVTSVVSRDAPENASVVLNLQGEGAGPGASLTLPGLSFPFIIRSRQPGDRIQTAGTEERSVASVLDGWKCAGQKDQIPLIQRLDPQDQAVIAIWGAPLGYKNWVVKSSK